VLSVHRVLPVGDPGITSDSCICRRKVFSQADGLSAKGAAGAGSVAAGVALAGHEDCGMGAVVRMGR
jgi:hypothetical protein